MKIFQMKSKPHSIERFRQFIDEKFVCIGWPGIGDLSGLSKDEIRNALEKTYKLTGHKLGNALGQVNTFVNTMDKGDIVIVAEKDWAYIGRVGFYIYDKTYDNNNDGMCHRRNVEWLEKSKITDLVPKVQKLIANRNTICEFPENIDDGKLDWMFTGKTKLSEASTDKLDKLFQDALLVLEEELKSEDPERRVKAATELIRLKTSN